ncbi:MAG: hypothetical protein E7058_00570, partial [Lentisphaerae bacterium]|nr:hypothetical protein [Lentisphaerota bacterium]
MRQRMVYYRKSLYFYTQTGAEKMQHDGTLQYVPQITPSHSIYLNTNGDLQYPGSLSSQTLDFYKQASGYDQTVTVETANYSGEILLSTLWNQSGAIVTNGASGGTCNLYCPYLPGTTTRTVTGCTNTAAGQILHFFTEKRGLDLQLQLTVDDEYTSSKDGTVIEIKSDGSTAGTVSFAEINHLLSGYNLLSTSCAAALMYACGVVQQANYGTSTGTAWDIDLMFRSGLKSANVIRLYQPRSYYWGSASGETYTLTDGAFEIIIDTLLAGTPIGVSYPGHALVLDGYDSSTDSFHVNFGWGKNSSTRWYTREEFKKLNFYEFIFDLSTTAENNFTVNDADFYGRGTMLRAFEQANSGMGDNTITFSGSVNNKSLELKDTIRLSDKNRINDFNMSVSVTDSRSFNIAIGFYANANASAEFNNFSGDLILNSNSVNNYGLYFDLANSLTVSANGALFFAGKYTVNSDYSAGAKAVTTALQNSRDNNSAVADTIVAAGNGTMFIGSKYNDVITLANRTISVGNFSLGDGDDKVSVSNYSSLYGVINLGSGNNTLTVDSTSRIYGMLTAATKLNIDLKNVLTNEAVFTLKQNVYNLFSYATSIAVNIAEAAVGTYTLFKAAAGALNVNFLKNISITVTGSGTADRTLQASGTASSEYADLLFENDALKLKVKGGYDTVSPTIPKNLSATVSGDGVLLDWEDSTDNAKVAGYMYRYGTSASLTGSGTQAVQSEVSLAKLAVGTWYYQVRSFDINGNYSDWSEVKSFIVKASTVIVSSGGTIVSSGTYLNGKMLNSGMTMKISSGGSADNTAVNSNAEMYVSSGGVANSTTVNSNGYLCVFAGAATNTTVNAFGNMRLVFNGTANNTIINSDGVMELFSGGTVNNTTINYRGSMYIINSGTANNTEINNSGYAIIYSGGKANSTTVNSGAYLGISSGGIANNTTVNSGAYLDILSGGTASGATVNHNGRITVAAGGKASAIKENGGYVDVGNGANVIFAANTVSGLSIDDRMTVHEHTVANDIIANSGGYIDIFSGGIANNTTIYSGGGIRIHAGGTVNNTTVNSVAYLGISSGGIANSTTVNAGGYMCISSGGTANSTTLNNGRMYIYYGGTANSTTVNSGTYLFLYTGGIANNTTINSGAYLRISSGVIANSTTVNAGGSMDVNTDAHAEKTVLHNHGTMTIAGTANSTVVSGTWHHSGGVMRVTNGGIASNTRIHAYGSATVYANARIISTTINYGDLWLSGGTASSTTVNYGGGLTLHSGSAIDTVANSDGRIFNSAVMSNITLNDYADCYVSSGGNAENIQVNTSASFWIYNGGAAQNISLQNQAELSLFGGSALAVTAADNAQLNLHSGNVRELTVKDNAAVNIENANISGMMLSSGTTLNGFSFTGDKYFNFITNGSAIISSGAVISRTALNISKGSVDKITFSAASMNICSGGTALNTMAMAAANVNVFRGGVASGTTQQFGSLTVSSGGSAADTILGTENDEYYYAGMFISSGGIAENTVIRGNAVMYLRGGIHRGMLYIHNNASVNVSSDSVIDFTLSSSTGSAYIINNLAKIKGVGNISPAYTITVANDQAAGTYKLAQGAENFSGSVSIGNGTTIFGSVAVNGEALKFNGTDYLLTEESGNLTLSICDLTAPEITISVNTASLTNKDVTLTATANENCVIKYCIGNGSWQTYTDRVTISANSVVNFRAIDNAGNIAEKSIYIDNIDKTAPTLDVSVNITELTNQDVILTASASDGKIEYFDNGKWNVGNSFTVSQNGAYLFRATDEAGNIAEKSIYIDNIDKTAPTLEISGNATAPTNKDVVLYASVSDGMVEYFANGKWNTGNTLTISQNGTYSFRATDAAGNITEKSVEVTCIDKFAPVISIIADHLAPKEEKVILTANITDDNPERLEYSLDGNQWHTYSSALSVSSNCAVYFRATDAAGNISNLTHDVTQIASAPVKIYSSGTLVADSNHIDNAKLVPGGNNQMFISSGGVANNTIVDNYCSMYVYSGGVANGATVYYMGQLYVDKGAVLNNGIIRFGKTYISSGGVASNTVVSHGGLVFVSSGGKMETATVSSGGWIHLYYGGHANNATVNGFGRFYVSNAASANNVTVNSNGLSFIYAGGKMVKSLIQKSGSVHVYGG